MDERPLKIYETLLEKYGRQHWWPAETPFEVVVGAILTQRTSWNNVELAIANLKKARMMSPEALARAPLRRVAVLMKPSGFYNQKAKRVKDLVTRVKKEYRSLDAFFEKDALFLRKELLELKGIGKETADSIILYAANKPIFVVDAYTKRLCERMGLIEKLDYDSIQDYFTRNLSEDVALYQEYHALIARHAKEACRTKPVCKGCALAERCRFRNEHAKRKY